MNCDTAQRFELLAAGKRVLGTHFDLDGQSLWFSTHAGKPGLARIALKPGAKPEEVPVPALSEDAIS